MEWTYMNQSSRERLGLRLRESNLPPRADRYPKPIITVNKPDSLTAFEDSELDAASRKLKRKLQRCIQIVGPYSPGKIH